MGVIEGLPEQWKNRRTADAVMAPSAILLAGAGAAAAILGGLPLLAALGVGGVAGLVRIATLLPRSARGTRVDPMSIADPWRGFVREALDAQRRYRKAVSSANAGPLRDRLVEIGERIDAGVGEVWRVARRGDALVDAIANLDAPSAHRELEEAKRTAEATPGPSADATVAALQSQVDSADRLTAVATDAKDRLRLLDARLDEAVARAVELSIQAEDVAQLGGLGGDVEALVGEMESLRVALEEAGGTAATA
ncbi:MAG TPA: hypothetical protein VFW06_09105 [Acidimicrobiia bacterium]|nr:hypothetical protein [Acidimicrobiia bacterium]